MNEFPNTLDPLNLENFHLYFLEYNLKILRKNIYEYLLNNYTKLKTDYFDLTKFFNNNKITENSIQQNLVKHIVTELKSLNWKIALVFNGTGLVICSTDEDLDKSTWKQGLDFEIQNN